MVKFVKPYFPRLINAVIFGCAFAFLGWIIPDFYLTYFDQRDYYIARVSGLDKVSYLPCDKLQFTVERNSHVKSPATFITMLVRLKDDKQKVTIARRQGLGDITFGSQSIANTFDIPCDAQEGYYILHRVVIYKVFDREKVFTYSSEPFYISK